MQRQLKHEKRCGLWQESRDFDINLAADHQQGEAGPKSEGDEEAQ